MKFAILAIFTFGLVSAQGPYGGPSAGQYRPQPQYEAQAPPQYRQPQQYSFQTPTTPRPFHPPAQVHYVNIGEKLAGDYKFGYDTGKGPAGQSFREEVRLPDGTVKGAYGYLDAEGKMRIVKYTAGAQGYIVEGDEASQSAAARASAPQSQPQYTAPAPRPVQLPPPPQPQAPPPTYSAQPRPQPIQYIPQPAPQPAPRPVAPYSPRPNYGYGPSQPASAPVQTGNPFGLPGVNLITVEPRSPPPRTVSPGFAFGGTPTKKDQEEEYYGPSVINAALLNYNIGASQG